MKRCPSCGKELPKEAAFCPYCMSKLMAEQAIASSPVRRGKRWLWIVWPIALCVMVAALWGIYNGIPTPSERTVRKAAKSTTGVTSGEAFATEITDTQAETFTTSAEQGVTTTTKSGVGAATATTTTKKGTTTTTKKGTTTTTRPNGTTALCASGHTWKAVVDTVEYPEVGHYEEVVVRYDNVTVYQCAVCYGYFESLSAYYTHFEEHIAKSDQLVVVFRELYETETQRKPVYGTKWVVDTPARTETVMVGYRCHVCGATK